MPRARRAAADRAAAAQCAERITMTLNTLRSDVAALGFEQEIDDEPLFLSAVNRALDMICADRPLAEKLKLHVSSPEISYFNELLEHHSGEETVISIEGRSVIFRSYGAGKCVIRDSSGAALYTLKNDNQLTRAFITGQATLTFSGDHYYTVSDLTVYKDTLSDNVTDIPEYYAEHVTDMKDISSCFKHFSSMPCDKNGRIIESARLEGTCLVLPRDHVGDVYIEYYRSPTHVTAEDGEADVDVSPECSHLLALLSASFMWLDDDTQKAQYYMSLYQSGMAELKRHGPAFAAGYTVNGWA